MTLQKHSKADHPIGFSVRAWWQVLVRTYTKMQSDNLSLISAGVAFYFLLAVFPLIGALVSLYGLFVSEQELQQHMSQLVGLIPQDSRYLLQEQIENVVNKANSTLSIGFAISLLLTIWSGGKGSQALITACNITYHEPSKRSFLVKLMLRFIFTMCALLLMFSALFLITALPSVVSFIGGISLTESQTRWISWPLLTVIFNFSLTSLYRYAPARRKAKWRWVTPGSMLATALWVVASLGFTLYVTEFASYHETYGSIGGVIILIMWFYMSAFVILFGAEFNSAMELQTSKDSTAGKDKPMGERGAYVADNIGSPPH